MVESPGASGSGAGPVGPLRAPDFSAPLDLEERLAQAPADGTVKGWLLQSVLRRAKERDVRLGGRTGYLAFKSYPLREHLELLAEASERLEPGTPPRETLRRIGREAYPAFRDSTLGRVVLASVGQGGSGAEGGRRGLQWLAKGYPLTSRHTRADVTIEDDRALIHLSNVWTFPDCYHLGIFEGAAPAFGRELGFRVCTESLADTWIEITWRVVSGASAEPPL